MTPKELEDALVGTIGVLVMIAFFSIAGVASGMATGTLKKWCIVAAASGLVGTVAIVMFSLWVVPFL